jgi:hypothetical protein
MTRQALDHSEATAEGSLDLLQLGGRQARQWSLAQSMPVDGAQVLGADIGGFQQAVTWRHLNAKKLGILVSLGGKGCDQHGGEAGIGEFIRLEHGHGADLAYFASVIGIETGDPDLAQTGRYFHHRSPAS